MLLLPPPKHLGLRTSGYHLAIHAPCDSGEQVAELSGRCGCPPVVQARIISCIENSERYDCIVSAIVRLDWFVGEIENLGGHVVVTDVEDLRKVA